MRFSSRSCSSLRVLRLYLEVAIFQPELREHAPRTTFVLTGCDVRAGAAADQGVIEPATAGLRKQARKPRDNFQKPFCEQEIRTAPQRERFDTHDLRRGFAAVKTNSHRTTARAIRHARSPQRVRRGQDKFARRHGESASTRTISAEGSPRSRQMRTGPQRERFDTHDLRRGFAAVKTDAHGTTARALRHARSPQRVRRGQDSCARDHSESASTRTISAEGSPRSRGFAAVKTDSYGTTARAIRHARSPQRVHRGQDKFARRHSESASTRTISAEGTFRKLPSGLPPP